MAYPTLASHAVVFRGLVLLFPPHKMCGVELTAGDGLFLTQNAEI